MKNNPQAFSGGVPTPEELEQINRYARSPLRAEEVYAFCITLCDNEVDRDGECFSLEALHTLAALYPGKPGLFDHSRKGRDQTARTYRAWVETDETTHTSLGEPYSALRARAYMVRTQANAGLIAEIDAGIKREVSVGCAVSRKTCSICGAEQLTQPCVHRPGRVYGGKRCHMVLSGVQDAYEWSFVAIPAQPNAGVTKSYFFQKGEEARMEQFIETLKNAQDGLTLTKGQVEALLTYLQDLEQLAEDGRQYQGTLQQEVIRLCALHTPQLDFGRCPALLQKCSTQELAELKAMLSAADAHDPPALQLAAVPEQKPTAQEHLAFQI